VEGWICLEGEETGGDFRGSEDRKLLDWMLWLSFASELLKEISSR
jgi:hypothetical protein